MLKVLAWFYSPKIDALAAVNKMSSKKKNEIS